jgi:hypothetical protein
VREGSRRRRLPPRPEGRDDLCRPGESFGALVGFGRLFGPRGARVQVVVGRRGAVVFSRVSCAAMLECWRSFAALVAWNLAGLMRKDSMRSTSCNCKNPLLNVVAGGGGDADSHNLEMKSGRGRNHGRNS